MIRWLALLAFAGALVVLATEWAVRRRHLPPRAWWPRAVRRAAAPLLTPIEHRLRRAGANPVEAPLWLLGLVIVVGLLATSLIRWLAGSIAVVAAMRGAGPSAWIRLALAAAIAVLMAAIVVRVIGSWLGAGRYARWVRPVYLLTDWIIEPIARRLPPMGMLDLSPFVAYLILLLLRSLVCGP